MQRNELVSIFIILFFVTVLTSCRVRLVSDPAAEPASVNNNAEGSNAGSDNLNDFTKGDRSNLNNIHADSSQTVENPKSQRKEFDENASAEIIEGTDRLIHGEGEGSGASGIGNNSSKTVMKLNENAEETALLTIITEEADEQGVSEEGKTADSYFQYYTTLLKDRSGSLFECKRLYVYWETISDHITIHKSSPEHTMILNAGAYDVSVRLQEERLAVDDGWVVRKDPGVIVKVVSSEILGSTVRSSEAAKNVFAALSIREGWQDIDAIRQNRVLLLSEELLSSSPLQIGAMLALAQTANPELYEDLDPAEALQNLIEEATGSRPEGIFFFSMRNSE